MLGAVNLISLLIACLAVYTYAEEEYEEYFIHDPWDEYHRDRFECSLEPRHLECAETVRYSKYARHQKYRYNADPELTKRIKIECYACCGPRIHYNLYSDKCECMVPRKDRKKKSSLTQKALSKVGMRKKKAPAPWSEPAPEPEPWSEPWTEPEPEPEPESERWDPEEARKARKARKDKLDEKKSSSWSFLGFKGKKKAPEPEPESEPEWSDPREARKARKEKLNEKKAAKKKDKQTAKATYVDPPITVDSESDTERPPEPTGEWVPYGANPFSPPADTHYYGDAYGDAFDFGQSHNYQPPPPPPPQHYADQYYADPYYQNPAPSAYTYDHPYAGSSSSAPAGESSSQQPWPFSASSPTHSTNPDDLYDPNTFFFHHDRD